MAKCRIDQPVAHMVLLCKDVLSLACTKFFHPIVHTYLSGTGLIAPFYRSTSSEPLPEWLSGRAGWTGLEWNANTSPDRVSRFICFSMWSEAPLNTRGGTNQTNLLPCGQKGQSVTKASCCEKECCGVAPSEQGLHDHLDIRHGSGWEENPSGNKNLLHSCWNVTFS